MITKDFIAENTSLEEFFSIINDLLKSSKVQEMKIYNQHAGTSCYKHCMQVAYYTYIVCKRLNLDYISATRGAMLHDLFLYDWHTHIREDKSWKGQHAFMHPKIALRNATQIFNLNDMPKVGVYFGKMIPPHRGHLTAILNALSSFISSLLHFFPT